MREETIVAKQKGDVCGEKVINIPESVEEAVEAYGAEKVVSYFNQHLKVATRAALYPKVASAGSIGKKTVYLACLANGCDDETARGISKYDGEA